MAGAPHLDPEMGVHSHETRTSLTSEQAQFPRHLDPQVLVSQTSSHPSSRRSIQKANLNQERLIHLFQSILLLSQRCSQRIQSHRPTVVLFDDRPEQPTVQLIEPMRV